MTKADFEEAYAAVTAAEGAPVADEGAAKDRIGIRVNTLEPTNDGVVPTLTVSYTSKLT